MLEFEGVSKSFADGTVAVDGVSVAVPRGQFCVILGASGAGKSTLLRMVNGLVTPTAGRVVFEGRTLDRRTLHCVRPRVAMVHQQFNLVGRLSVLDNVLTGALPRVAGWRAALRLFPRTLKRRACGLLAEVGMEPGQLYRRAASLSGGQQQRVAIARAFILEPEVLLADEPVASLDPGTSVEVLSLLRRACEEHGTTALCSLHQVDLALRYADRIVAMRGGKLVFDGTPGELERRGLAGVYSRAAGHDPGRARAAAGSGVQRVAAAEVGLP